MDRVTKQYWLTLGKHVLLGSIIFLGVLIGAARLLLPGIVEYRTDIETMAATILEAPVTIGSVESGWSGLHPVVTLKDIQVQQRSGKRVLELESLDIVLGIIPSLLAAEFHPTAIILRMQRLELHRGKEGRLSFNLGGLTESGESQLGKDQFNWIFNQPDLHIDIESFGFTDLTEKLPALNLQNVGIDFVNQGDQLVARLNTGASDAAQGASLIVSLAVNQLTLSEVNADIFLELKSASLSFWKNTFAHTFDLPDSGHTDASIWMAIEEGEIRQVSSDLSLGRLAYKQSASTKVFSLDSMTGQFDWRLTGTGWMFKAARLQLQRLGKQWPESSMSVEYRRGSPDRYLIDVDYFRMQDFLSLIDRQSQVHAIIGEDLQKISPAGEITELKLQLAVDQQAAIRTYTLQARLADLSTNAHGVWPGLGGLDGTVVATERAGLLQLQTTDALLDLKTIFRDPLRLEILQGDINWTRLPSGLLVEASQLDASNTHLSTQSRLSVHVPNKGDVFVDMQTNFKEGDGAYTSFYLPAKELGEETTAWLDKGIVAGHVEYGSFILHGAVSDFPFDNGDGRFEVRFKVRDAILEYYEDWPVIDQIEAEVAFVGRSMMIEATSGKIFGAEISNTIVSIPDLDSDNPLLHISGEANTSSDDLFRYLKETKLAGDYQAALAELNLQGKNDLKLDIKLPLSDGDPVVKGQLTFLDNQLSIGGWGLQIDKISGLLDFTEASFMASDIKGIFNEREVVVNVSTQATADGPEIRITGNSQFEISRFIEPRNKRLANQFSGVSPFEVQIDLPDSQPSKLKVRSDLVGTQLKFPHPLNKSTDEAVPFLIQTGFSGRAAEQIELQLGERLTASVVLDEETKKLTSGYVTLGKDTVKHRPSGQQGVLLGGRLDFLDINAWKDWYQDLDITGDEENFSAAFSTDFVIEKMHYARWLMENFSVKANYSDNILRAHFTGEAVLGSLIYTSSDALPMLDLDLDHLAIKQRPQVNALIEKNQAGNMKPSDMVGVDIQVAKLAYDQRDIGQLQIKAEPINGQYEINTFSLKTDETEFDLSGGWRYTADNGHVTQLGLGIESRNFGRFMQRLGYDDTVEDGEASVQASFTANTSPENITIASLEGEVSLSILKGEVKEIDPGGAGRIFGLLSLQTLPRRLSLDFKDIFSKGMRFDEIEGTFSISGGQAYTNNLTMDAPSSQVEVSGRVGLNDEDYDQYVRVIPNLSSTLPIAGALAGGPGLAVVMLLTHQLLQKPIDELTELEYQVTGPWKSPEVVSVAEKKEVSISESEQ